MIEIKYEFLLKTYDSKINSQIISLLKTRSLNL